MLKEAVHHAETHTERYISDLIELLRIPSISTDPAYADDVQRAAAWVRDYLAHIGLDAATIHQTAGQPIVTASWLHAGPGAPTLLIYGHFDVQPADPAEWVSAPFEPEIRGDKLYARGASDDKGQFMALLAGLDSLMKTAGGLPCNVTVLIEGEEEINSPSLPGFITTHQDFLACDGVIAADNPMLTPQQPVILYGLRGQCHMEVTITGPQSDLHSGMVGGAVDNPLNVLSYLMSQLYDLTSGQILVEGFHDNIRELSDEDRTLLEQSPADEAMLKALTGVQMSGGDKRYSVAERISIRPTFDITGMAGGYFGPGKKSIIPAKATAKISTRLVPDQTPEEISAKVEAHLRSLLPPTVSMSFNVMATSYPVVLDPASPAIRAADAAYQAVMSTRPVYLRGGGSLPIVHDIKETLGTTLALVGFGLPDDNIHAPNERLHLPNFRKGIHVSIHYLDQFAARHDHQM